MTPAESQKRRKQLPHLLLKLFPREKVKNQTTCVYKNSLTQVTTT